MQRNQDDFIARRGRGTAIVSSTSVFLSYFAAFLLCALMLYSFEDNPSIILCSFLIFFGLAVANNYLHLRYAKSFINSLNQELELLYDALAADSENFLVLNSHGKVVLRDRRLSELNLPKLLAEQDDLAIVLNINQVPLQIQQTLRDAILEESAKSWVTKVIQYLPKRNILLKRLMSSPESIQKKLILAKVSKVNDEVLEALLDDLTISYYELDVNGEILNCNKHFAKLLAYQQNNLANGTVKFIDLIDIESSMNELILNANSVNALIGNWQGFLKFKTKFNDKVSFFVLHKLMLNSYGQVEKVKGFALKVIDNSVMLKGDSSQKGWLDYSWQSFFESSPYAVAIASLDGKLIRVNQAFASLMSLENSEKASFFDVIKKEDGELIHREFKNAADAKHIAKPLKNIRSQNSNKTLEVHFGKILNLKGQTDSLLLRVTDITPQKELQDNLSHAQRMQTIGQLVGSVAHDFNNLLTAISGFCDLLFLKHTIGDPSFAHIMQIKQNSDRAANLVKRLLAFSRKQTLHLNITNLSDLFADFTTLIKRLIGNDIKFTLDIDPNLWFVKIDPLQMEQVILNLVVNANQAIKAQGELKVTLKNEVINKPSLYLSGYFTPDIDDLPSAGEYVVIEVTDNGLGIDPEIMPNIFEPFFTTKAEKSGTGLGLSTVYGIVRQSEGYIHVKSRLGEGTTFLILLRRYNPAQDGGKEPVKQVEEKPIDSPAYEMAKGVIALIEDEDSVRLFAKNVLVNRGYEVIEFSSAKEAAQNLDSFIHNVDLIVSDVVMPEMSGPALIKEIKKIKPKIKVIFISGYAEEAFDEEFGMDRNFNFIPKPFSLKTLLEKVKEVLRTSV
jgi:two-component system cell cycle sensor histidine kinase/response regulator CckA